MPFPVIFVQKKIYLVNNKKKQLLKSTSFLGLKATSFPWKFDVFYAKQACIKSP